MDSKTVSCIVTAILLVIHVTGVHLMLHVWIRMPLCCVKICQDLLKKQMKQYTTKTSHHYCWGKGAPMGAATTSNMANCDRNSHYNILLSLLLPLKWKNFCWSSLQDSEGKKPFIVGIYPLLELGNAQLCQTIKARSAHVLLAYKHLHHMNQIW